MPPKRSYRGCELEPKIVESPLCFLPAVWPLQFCQITPAWALSLVNGHPEKMDYKIVLGNDNVADNFGGLLGLPASFLYGRDGTKVKTIVGLADSPPLAVPAEHRVDVHREGPLLVRLGGRSTAADKRRIGPRVQDIAIQEEIRQDRAGLGKLGMLVKRMRYAGERVQFRGNSRAAKHLQHM
jgi:hypothetical protein